MSALWPEAKSPKELLVRYMPSGINKVSLKEAQSLASKMNQEDWNRGNMRLTAAYWGGDINNAFWCQFNGEEVQ